MTTLTLRLTNSPRSITLMIMRHPRVIAEAIARFARSRGVSPLSVEYRVG